jgi:hypothetical protein
MSPVWCCGRSASSIEAPTEPGPVRTLLAGAVPEPQALSMTLAVLH